METASVKYVVRRELLEQNISLLKKQAGQTPIWAVLKGDGYGLGTERLALLLSEQGIDHFCVTELSEAARLRADGHRDARILMLRSVCDRQLIHELLDLDVILTLGSLEAVRAVEAVAAERSDLPQVHIKIDTGMGRYGFYPWQLDQILSIYRDTRFVAITGIYTHFSSAAFDEKRTRAQFAAFQELIQRLYDNEIEPGMIHCCNSAAFLRYPEMHLGGVRLGSALLGRVAVPSRLRPVGQLESVVEELHQLPKGHSTGYSAIWKARRDSTLAIVPVGWYHGFRGQSAPAQPRARDCLREVYSGLKKLLRRPVTWVEVGGRRCPVVGVVGMLHCAVDVTGLDCRRGDRVELPANPLYVKGAPVEFR